MSLLKRLSRAGDAVPHEDYGFFGPDSVMWRVYTQPKVRYDRTLAYFATVAFGDSRTAIEASATLVKVHSMAKGIEPISGKIYDANDPAQQPPNSRHSTRSWCPAPAAACGPTSSPCAPSWHRPKQRRR